MASLTCGTVNFGRGVFENPAPLMLEFARAQLAAGVRPELEIFDAGHLDNARWLVGKAPLEGPQHYDLVLGRARRASPARRRTWCMLSDRLPPGSTWSATGIGRSFLPVTTAALACGGHVRCGFEDQVEVEPGVPAGVERRPGRARRGDREAARPRAGDAGAGARAARAYVSSIAGRCAASSSRTRSSVTCGNSS